MRSLRNDKVVAVLCFLGIVMQIPIAYDEGGRYEKENENFGS